MQVTIKKGTVSNVVSKELYAKVYEPNGWTIVGPVQPSVIQKELDDKGIVNEQQQNAYIKSKQERRQFDDGLFEGE